MLYRLRRCKIRKDVKKTEGLQSILGAIKDIFVTRKWMLILVLLSIHILVLMCLVRYSDTIKHSFQSFNEDNSNDGKKLEIIDD